MNAQSNQKFSLGPQVTPKKSAAGLNKTQTSFQCTNFAPKMNSVVHSKGPSNIITPRNNQTAKAVDSKVVITKIREKMRSRGARGIMGLGRAFRNYDDSGNGSLDLDEAMKAFAELRIGLTDDERMTAFQIFDRDHSGSINYEEFLRTVRGSMNNFRERLAMKAFAKMDKDGSGVI